MPESLTKRQHQVLAYVEAYIAEHGYSPSYEEIGGHIGAGLSTVHEHIGNLVARGRLAREHNRGRSLQVLLSAGEGETPGAEWVHRSELPALFRESLRTRGMPEAVIEVLRGSTW